MSPHGLVESSRSRAKLVLLAALAGGLPVNTGCLTQAFSMLSAMCRPGPAAGGGFGGPGGVVTRPPVRPPQVQTPVQPPRPPVVAPPPPAPQPGGVSTQVAQPGPGGGSPVTLTSGVPGPGSSVDQLVNTGFIGVLNQHNGSGPAYFGPVQIFQNGAQAPGAPSPAAPAPAPGRESGSFFNGSINPFNWSWGSLLGSGSGTPATPTRPSGPRAEGTPETDPANPPPAVATASQVPELTVPWQDGSAPVLAGGPEGAGEVSST